MIHWIIAPVVLPALLAPLIGFVMRHDITLARAASFAGTIALFAMAIGLAVMADDGETYVYRLGNWAAPFGIVLVLDRLSALMVLLTSGLALIALFQAATSGWDNRGRHFHALFQFQLMGINGAFLTGDIFNLFVFFEILLIASYGLMIHSGGRARMRAGLQYVVYNLAGSTLFLFALGTLYASTGTLNIADLSVRIAEIPVEEAGLVRVAVMLLLIVFMVKAAMFPVQFWLPGTYANAPAPVAALFAIMTKVGAYAILRIHTTSFGPGVDATSDIGSTWLFPAAVITIAIGALGVIGARRLMPLIAFSVLGSMGTLMIAVSAFSPTAVTAALYYLVHSTFAAAALFLVADLVLIRRRDDTLATRPATAQNGLFAIFFFAAAIGMAGMPPLSGFLGKLLVLDATRDPALMPWAWSAVLIGSLVTVVGFARAGSTLFWKSTSVETPPREEHEPPPTPTAGLAELTPSAVALTMMAMLAVFAGPVASYLEGTGAQLFDRRGYVTAVLDRTGANDPQADYEAAYGDDHGEDHADDGHGGAHGDDHGDDHSAPQGEAAAEDHGDAQDGMEAEATEAPMDDDASTETPDAMADPVVGDEMPMAEPETEAMPDSDAAPMDAAEPTVEDAPAPEADAPAPVEDAPLRDDTTTTDPALTDQADTAPSAPVEAPTSVETPEAPAVAPVEEAPEPDSRDTRAPEPVAAPEVNTPRSVEVETAPAAEPTPDVSAPAAPATDSGAVPESAPAGNIETPAPDVVIDVETDSPVSAPPAAETPTPVTDEPSPAETDETPFTDTDPDATSDAATPADQATEEEE